MDTSTKVNEYITQFFGKHILWEDDGLNAGGLLSHACLSELSKRPFVDVVVKELRSKPFVYEKGSPEISHKTWADNIGASTPVSAIVSIEEESNSKEVSRTFNKQTYSIPAFQKRTYIAFTTRTEDELTEYKFFFFHLSCHSDDKNSYHNLEVEIPTLEKVNQLLTKKALKKIQSSIISRYEEELKMLQKKVFKIPKAYANCAKLFG